MIHDRLQPRINRLCWTRQWAGEKRWRVRVILSIRQIRKIRIPCRTCDTSTGNRRAMWKSKGWAVGGEARAADVLTHGLAVVEAGVLASILAGVEICGEAAWDILVGWRDAGVEAGCVCAGSVWVGVDDGVDGGEGAQKTGIGLRTRRVRSGGSLPGGEAGARSVWKSTVDVGSAGVEVRLAEPIGQIGWTIWGISDCHATGSTTWEKACANGICKWTIVPWSSVCACHSCHP